MGSTTWQQRVDELPPTLAVALRLHHAGHPDSVVATALGVPPEGVPGLLQVARAKLHHVRDPGPGDRWDGHEWSTSDGNEWSTSEGNQWSTTEGPAPSRP